MARWAPDGRARLRRGHVRLDPGEAWLSDTSLQARYDNMDLTPTRERAAGR